MKQLKTVILLILFGVCHNMGYSQEIDTAFVNELQRQITQLRSDVNSNKPGKHAFLFTGFTNLTYHQDLNRIQVSKFDHAGFSPIMLWKPADRLFFEAELHIEMEGGVHGGELDGDAHGGHGGGEEDAGHEGSTSFALGFANMIYMVRPGIILTAGKFLTPLGIFNERYHPTWINPLPVNPIGMGHGGPFPSAELGVQIRGGIQTGATKMTYVIYVSNGPIFNEGQTDSQAAANLIYSNFTDNNANKALGGRISFFPLSNSTLELGFSGQFAPKTGDRNTKYENIGASISAYDLTYNKTISSIGLLKISGQYATVKIDDVNFTNTLEEIENGADLTYTFDNTSTFYYSSASLRPIQSDKNFIKNSEITIRYEGGKTPMCSKWHSDENRTLIGYTYWLHARSALKLAVSLGDANVLYTQFALGF